MIFSVIRRQYLENNVRIVPQYNNINCGCGFHAYYSILVYNVAYKFKHVYMSHWQTSTCDYPKLSMSH